MDQRPTGASAVATAANEVGLAYEDLNCAVLNAEDVVRAKSVLDSGACRNCLGPDDLPAGVEASGKPERRQFCGCE